MGQGGILQQKYDRNTKKKANKKIIRALSAMIDLVKETIYPWYLPWYRITLATNKTNKNEAKAKKQTRQKNKKQIQPKNNPPRKTKLRQKRSTQKGGKVRDIYTIQCPYVLRAPRTP